MVFDEDFDVSVRIYDVSAVANCVRVITNNFAYRVKDGAKFFDVKAEEVNLGVVEFLNFV